MAKLFERDLKKRSLGCIGVSMLIHAGVAATMVLAPKPSDLDFGAANGNGGNGSELVMIDGEDAGGASAGESSPIEVTTNSEAQATATTAAAAEVVLVNPPAKPVVNPPASPIEEATTPLPQKTKSKTKPAVARTVGIGSSAPKDGDVEIKAALAAARDSESGTSRDEGRTEDFMPTSPMDVTEVESEEASEESIVQPAPILQANSTTELGDDETEETEETTPAKTTSAAATSAADSTTRTGTGSGSGAGTGSALTASAAGSGSGAGAGIPVGVQIRDASKLVPAAGNRSFVYPQQDRLKRREGTAWVVGRVTQQGSIAEVYLERSSGSKTMDEEALRTFKSWKFMPGQEGFVRQPVQFVLQGEAEEVKATLRN
jgi:TonB family protein